MKNLLNYCAIEWYEDDLVKNGFTLDEYLRKYDFAGIEQFFYNTYIPTSRYQHDTVGGHLTYWAYWLDLWENNVDNMRSQFISEQEKCSYFGGAKNKDEWLSVIRGNINIALSQKPEYLVWHVAECNLADIYTFSFRHSDEEIVKAAAEVFNCVADIIPDSVPVLFENLWWPGLRLLDKNVVHKFFSLIKKANVGIMLDTGHLLNTNDQLENEQQAIEYILMKLAALGTEAERIKGIHLNYSLSGEYQRSFKHHIPENIDEKILTEHIVAIDQHRPFTQNGVRRILEKIKPEYLVHELNYKDFSQLDELLAAQLAACGLFDIEA